MLHESRSSDFSKAAFFRIRILAMPTLNKMNLVELEELAAKLAMRLHEIQDIPGWRPRTGRCEAMDRNSPEQKRARI